MPTPRNKTRLKAVAAPTVPQTRDQVAELIARIGSDNRALQVIEAEMNDALANVKAQYELLSEPIRQNSKAAFSGVQAWCEANRAELTVFGKVKTHSFSSGDVAWRTRPPSVRITGEDAVLFSLRSLGLMQFIRTKEEINREAILNEPEKVVGVPGIKISQIEDFVVTPFEVELAQ
jgi:phage host-nuclease inhibitor protein Gam